MAVSAPDASLDLAAEPRRSRRDYAVRIAVAVLVLAAIAIVLGPAIAPHDPAAIDFANRLQPPTWEYPLGTDQFGRCVLSRLIAGFRVTPLAAIAVVISAVGIGTALGLAAGFIGGVPDRVLMRLVEGVQVFPALAVSLVIAGVLGLGLATVVLSLAAVHWTEYARLVRNMTLSERAKAHVLAAEALGATRLRIALRHVLPNIASPIVVMAAFSLSWAILAFAGLSFLGLGAEPSSPEWGVMIAEARGHLRSHPRLMLAPGLTIVVVVIAVNLLGDAWRDRAQGRSHWFRNLLSIR